MCIAILKKAGAVITDDVLETCYQNNSDGCGYAHVGGDGSIKIFKSMSFDAFLASFREAEESSDSPFLIHFRIATHGTVDEFNCHPFVVDEDTAFIHNGVIHDVRTDITMSDTQVFNQDILQNLPQEWVHNVAFRPLIEKFIGYSKLVVLKRDKSFSIFNENKGEWREDKEVWFSNTSYKRWKSTYTYNGKAGGRGVKGSVGTATGSSTTNKGQSTTGNTGVSSNPTVPATTSSKVIPFTKKEQEDRENMIDLLLLDKHIDYLNCSNCGNPFLVKDLAPYEAMEQEEDQLFCGCCEEELLTMMYLDPKDCYRIEEYVEDYNAEVRARMDDDDDYGFGEGV